jgi:hypothetical protein
VRLIESEEFYVKFKKNLSEDTNLLRPLEKAALKISQRVIKSDSFSNIDAKLKYILVIWLPLLASRRQTDKHIAHRRD